MSVTHCARLRNSTGVLQGSLNGSLKDKTPPFPEEKRGLSYSLSVLRVVRPYYRRSGHQLGQIAFVEALHEC